MRRCFAALALLLALAAAPAASPITALRSRKRGGTGKVEKQKPAPGKLIAPGSKVKVTLG